MLMSQALQDRFERTGDAVARRYTLSVGFSITGEALGIQSNSTATRVRMVGNASWDLNADDPGHTHLSSVPPVPWMR